MALSSLVGGKNQKHFLKYFMVVTKLGKKKETYDVQPLILPTLHVGGITFRIGSGGLALLG